MPVTLLQYGTARGTVIDAVAGYGPPTDLLDDKGNPVYQTADGTRVYFDPAVQIPVPPDAGTGAVAAYPDATGRTVVRYSDDTYRRLGVGDAPAEPLTVVQETVGNNPLSGYELLLYRTTSGSPVCVGTIVSNGAEWEIDPSMQLLAGSYALRFRPLDGEVGTNCANRGKTPDGFAEMPIDPATSASVAIFNISESLDEKEVLPPILVAPYPAISGEVLIPESDGAGGVTFADFDDDLTGLQITLTCNGTTATLPVTAGSAGEAQFGRTRIEMQQLFAGAAYDPTTGDLPPCAFHATYAGPGGQYLPVDYSTTIRVGLRAPYPDRSLHLAMVQDPGTIVGVVQWTDQGLDLAHSVAGAVVQSEQQIPVEFTTAESADGAAAGDPGQTLRQVTATTGGSGGFAFIDDGQRQLVGSEPYSVAASHYVTRETGTGTPPTPDSAVTVTVDDDAGTWAASGDGVVMDAGSAVIDVQADPDPDGFTGQVIVQSLRGQAAADEVTVGATPPSAATGTAPTPLTVAADGSFAVGSPSAEAGTWGFTYGVTPTSNLVVASAATRQTFVPPDGPDSVGPGDTSVPGRVQPAIGHRHRARPGRRVAHQRHRPHPGCGSGHGDARLGGDAADTARGPVAAGVRHRPDRRGGLLHQAARRRRPAARRPGRIHAHPGHPGSLPPRDLDRGGGSLHRCVDPLLRAVDRSRHRSGRQSHPRHR